MTATITAENGSDATAEPVEPARGPVPASQIDHDALYAALSMLTGIAGVVLEHVDRNAADVHRDLERLRNAHQRAHRLLFPPPPPETAEGAEVLYAHAVRSGDLLWRGYGPGFTEVVSSEPYPYSPGRVRMVFRDDKAGASSSFSYEATDLLVVMRPKPKADPS